MKNALLLITLVAGLHVAQSADAVYVTVDPSARQYQNQIILLGRNKAVGTPGDYFELRDGTHFLYIYAPRNHYVELKIDVRGDSLEVRIDKDQSYDERGCKQDWITEWRGRLQTTQSRIRPGVLWTIFLPEIRFVHATDSVYCSLPSSQSCKRKAYSLSVHTEPKNAEILINGERVGHRTPKPNLRQSYCQWEESVQILTRAPGHVNCAKEFKLYPDADLDFYCKMIRQ